MMRGRPVTRKKASEILRTEGYTPEEIAVRTIPSYVPAPSLVDDPSSQPVGDQPGNSPPAVEPQSPHAAAISPVQNFTLDMGMPPSSPPPASPSPQNTPITRQLENMSIEELERGSMGTYSHIMVPLSSPSADNVKKGTSTPGSTRSARGKRRSSFAQMSSSPPPDEFSAPRKQPLPESPSMAVMMAEREKALGEKARERENMAAAERERELRRGADKAAEKNQRTGSPPRGLPSVIRLGRTRGRLRGRGLMLSTIAPPGTPQTKAPAPSPSPRRPPSASQDTVEKLMSQYTHADSDEDVHANLMENLGGADWGLQTQVPYTTPTQDSYGYSEVSASHGGSQPRDASEMPRPS
ncbi:hypothetical protein BN14_11143 [Rhizoctonia solani AG-1 IB]|uniref:Uncharacterized protein n=1 Tax=Thanatephorus cucumeris (strain AG1-IB / isolate 7/3/14) TaxID=1108050 RepID=M5CAG5_THACB|nr:hypothetical protein BN14_11143 [Rhizoctonia solani AG-1 IB]